MHWLLEILFVKSNTLKKKLIWPTWGKCVIKQFYIFAIFTIYHIHSAVTLIISYSSFSQTGTNFTKFRLHFLIFFKKMYFKPYEIISLNKVTFFIRRNYRTFYAIANTSGTTIYIFAFVIHTCNFVANLL